MSNNLQTLTALSRTERDATGRQVHIYRRKEYILTKEQAKEYKAITELGNKQDPDNLKQWEGPALLPISK